MLFRSPGSVDPWRVCSPWVIDGAAPSTALCGVPFPPLRRRRAVVSSNGGFGSVRWCAGGGLLVVVACYGRWRLDLPPYLQGDFNCCSMLSRCAGFRSCGHGEAEDDDFPPAISFASSKVSPARRWCGGGGEARPRLASVSSVFRGPRDRVVFSGFRGVCCNGSC